MFRHPAGSILSALGLVSALAVAGPVAAATASPAAGQQPATGADSRPAAPADVNASLAELTLQITRLRERVDGQDAVIEQLRRQLRRVITPDSDVGVVRPVGGDDRAPAAALPSPPQRAAASAAPPQRVVTGDGLVFRLLGCPTTAAGSRCMVVITNETTTSHQLDLSIVGAASFLVERDGTHVLGRGASVCGSEPTMPFRSGDSTLVTIDLGVPFSGTYPRLVVPYRLDGRVLETTFEPVVFQRRGP